MDLRRVMTVSGGLLSEMLNPVSAARQYVYGVLLTVIWRLTGPVPAQSERKTRDAEC